VECETKEQNPEIQQNNHQTRRKTINMLSRLLRFQAPASRLINRSTFQVKPFAAPLRAISSGTSETSAVPHTPTPGEPTFDTYTLNYFLRCDELMDELKIPDEEREKTLEEVDFSQGVFTLEWMLPDPVPEHLFSELPIIKEVKGTVF